MSDTFRYDFVDEGSGKARRSIRTGSTWRRELTIKDSGGVPVDISTWQFEMMVRKTPSSDTVILELSSGNGKIVFVTDGTDGKIQLVLTASETSALIDDIGENTYDLKYVLGADTKDLLEGLIEILASNTRS